MTPDCSDESLRPALAAIDEVQVRRHGHLVAIAKSPSEETARRRASLVLGQHHQGMTRVDPAEVADGLRIWAVLRGVA